MIDSIILFMQESFRNNIILIISLTALCVIVDYLRSNKKRQRFNIVKFKPDKDIVKIYKETRLFIYINNKKYYLKNFEDSDKINKLLDLKDIVLDEDNNEFYFINKNN